nr:immunoglobulin heavy chain junction region [Mus musculus]
CTREGNPYWYFDVW